MSAVEISMQDLERVVAKLPRFWTAEQLADEFGVSQEEALNLARRYPRAVRPVAARNKAGARLFTSAKREPSTRERLLALRASVAKSF